MAGCFGNHWVDRCLEQQLFDHLRKEDEADELAELEEEMEDEKSYLEYPDDTYGLDFGYDTDASGNCYSDADPGL